MLSDKQKLEAIYKVANNVLYFDDISDYQTSLWEILEIFNPEIYVDDPEPELKLIE